MVQYSSDKRTPNATRSPGGQQQDDVNRANGGGMVGARGYETYESLNIEPKPLRPHILAAATVVFGDDYYSGRRETISLSGFTAGSNNTISLQPVSGQAQTGLSVAAGVAGLELRPGR